jgi:Ca2+-dependent lipid-binding protein
VIGNQNGQNGDNKEKEFEMEKTASMALLAIQSSEDRVPLENYDPSEAVSSSSENKNEETAQEQDENVEKYLGRRDAGLSCDNDLKWWVFEER